MEGTLKVNEIFLGIQGEGTRAGLPCTLVRLAGCNLRCRWCDTSYAWEQGAQMSIDQVLRRVADLGCPRVELTGGEPLLQAASLELLRCLCEAGCQTLLETNGSQDISAVDPRVVRIVDFKCPSSGEAAKNRWENVAHLTRYDEVKFVLADRADYEFARDAAARHDLPNRCAVILSPVFGQVASAIPESALAPATPQAPVLPWTPVLSPATLAEWILADGLDVRLGLQLHKIIWPGKDRGV